MSEQNKTDAVQSIAELQEALAKRDVRIGHLIRELTLAEKDIELMAHELGSVKEELAALKSRPADSYGGEFSKGDIGKVGDCDKFEAGIHHLTFDACDMVFDGKIVRTGSTPGTWFQRIAVYGSTAEQAESLRDFVLSRISRQSGGVVLPEQDGSNAQISFWAGFEAAVCGLHGVNIRAAWNEFKSSEQFARLNSSPVSAGVALSGSRTGRVYIAGPMTGYENHNFAAFNAEADRLRRQGLHVENPADHGVVDGADWADYLRYDIGRLASCERIHLLPGWSKSKGARLEVHIAQALGMHIWYAEGAETVSAGGVDDLAAFDAWWSTYPLGDSVNPNSSADRHVALQVWLALAGMSHQGVYFSLSCPECNREATAFTMDGLIEAWNKPTPTEQQKDADK